MTTTVKVSRFQIKAAQALIRIAGGEDKVEPIIVKIANARPAGDDLPSGANGG